MRVRDREVAGLRVEEHVLGPDDGTSGLPLVVALHGRGGTPGLPWISPASYPVRVLVPHGPHAVAGARAWSPVSVTSGHDDALAADLAVSAASLDAMIAVHLAERPAHGAAILAGYSQGAMVALALAARVTRRYALVLGAAWAPPTIEAGLAPAAIASIQAAHGDADPIVPLAPTRALFDRLRSRGIEAELREFPSVGHEASPAMEETLAKWLADSLLHARSIHVYSPPEVALVLDILLAPDVFVNASVAAGTPPEHIARRVLGKPDDKPKSTRWVMTWVHALLTKTPGFRADHVDAQMKTIESLCDIVEVQDKTPEGDWVQGLVASAKAAGLKRVVTDHPDLADKTEVDGIAFLSSEAWLVEATTPPPPPPPKKPGSTPSTPAAKT